MTANSKVVVIGTSAGGPDALRRLLGLLPPDLPAAILVVMHIGRHYSILPKILGRDVGMPVRHAEDNESIVPGTILIAPPDHHMLVEDGLIRLSRAAKENFARSAIDPLFRCAAFYYRENAIGVVLTRMLDDGTIGLQAIKAYGGVALVQDPDEADEPDMPRSALQYVEVDGCLSINGLAQRLIELTASENTEQRPEPKSTAEWDKIAAQSRFALRHRTDIDDLGRIATPAGIACPECHGGLWQVDGANPCNFAAIPVILTLSRLCLTARTCQSRKRCGQRCARYMKNKCCSHAWPRSPINRGGNKLLKNTRSAQMQWRPMPKSCVALSPDGSANEWEGALLSCMRGL